MFKGKSIIAVWFSLIPAIIACDRFPVFPAGDGGQEGRSDSNSQLADKLSEAWSVGEYLSAFETATELCQREPESIRLHLILGDVSFAAGKMEESIAAYDAAIRMDPDLKPRLWQRGLALYYAGRFAEGVEQFETHQNVNSQDVENAVWHLLCAARVTDLESARQKLIPVSRDLRVPMAEIYEMFAGRMSPDEVLRAAVKTSAKVPEGSSESRRQQYFAWLYTGLYQEMIGKEKAALESMRKAEELNPLDKTSFMGQVARVHMELRSARSSGADEDAASSSGGEFSPSSERASTPTDSP